MWSCLHWVSLRVCLLGTGFIKLTTIRKPRPLWAAPSSRQEVLNHIKGAKIKLSISKQANNHAYIILSLLLNVCAMTSCLA